MSLEQAIQENTNAIRELIAALAAAPVMPLAVQAAEEVTTALQEVAKAEKPKDEKPKAAIKQQEPEQPKAEEPAVDAPAITADDCKQITLQLASKKGRDAAVAVLAEFGVGKASELKADQLAEYHAAATAALGV